MLTRTVLASALIVSACSPRGQACNYAEVAKEAIHRKDGSISFENAVLRSIEDFQDSKAVVISLPDDQRYGGAGVMVRRSDCKVVDIELGGVWSGE